MNEEEHGSHEWHWGLDHGEGFRDFLMLILARIKEFFHTDTEYPRDGV